MINKNNYYNNTFVVYKGCKRPKRQPDYISYTIDYGYETDEKKISSEYWYGTDKHGDYVIRSSDHWASRNGDLDCKNVSHCIWNLFIPRKSNTTKGNNKSCGKAYFSWFKARTK